MAAKPGTVNHIVISVPHSGTRTLQTWLTEHRPELVPSNKQQVAHWHFNLHPKYIQFFFEQQKCGTAYIPVRNPLDVADSWQRRYGEEPDKTAEHMIEALESMIRVLGTYPFRAEAFKIEELPVLRGVGPRPEKWSRADLACHDRGTKLRQWLSTPLVERFYGMYYNAAELQW